MFVSKVMVKGITHMDKIDASTDVEHYIKSAPLQEIKLF